MSVLIDPPIWPGHGRVWSHLISDVSYSELHDFADRLGAPRRGFDGDHYDVPAEHYGRAVELGAMPVSSRELVARLTTAGLRRRKRRGEQVVDTFQTVDGFRVDVVRSRLEPAVPPSVRHLAVTRREDVFLVLSGAEAPRLPTSQELPGLAIRAVSTGYARWIDRRDQTARTEQLIHVEVAEATPWSAAFAGSWQSRTSLDTGMASWVRRLLA